jgi:hypothetical protein
MSRHRQTFLLAVAIDAAVRIPLLAGLPETLDADA